MHLVGEVVPAAPAVVGLVEIALLLLAFALVFVVRKFLEALFGWVADLASYIPGAGGAVEGWIRSAEQAVANALGTAEHGIDAAIGASWHMLARYTEWLWREIRGNAALLLDLALSISPIAKAIAAIRALVHHLHGTSQVQSAKVKTLEREFHGIDAKLERVQRQLRGIDDLGVGKRLGQVEQEIASIETQTIPAIQQADSDAASAISNLYEWAKGKAALLGVGTFSLAVAGALDALGLGGLRCPSFLRSLNNRGCGLFNGLEDILGLFVDLFIITDLCEVIPLLETAYADVAAPAVAALTEAIDSMPCVTGHQPPALIVPRLHLPANPSLALSLP